jgi:hypothetical protein
MAIFLTRKQHLPAQLQARQRTKDCTCVQFVYNTSMNAFSIYGNGAIGEFCGCLIGGGLALIA